MIEAKALLNSNWWGNFSSTNHCELMGITCNWARSVTQIELISPYCSQKLESMNWTSLPNLELLNLVSCNLTGSIPEEIGTVSKLTNLYLSRNNLEGSLQDAMEKAIKNKVTKAVVLAIDVMFQALRLWAPLPESNGQTISRLRHDQELQNGEEFAYTMVVTEKCDAYSFGVVALETIMGRHLGELLSSLESPSARNIILADVLDPRLPLLTNPMVVGNIVLVARMAIACLRFEPRSRSTMLHVSRVSIL
ncbi:MDIS1-interacting receptor like kinase 2 [Camellia lanceoleosa]|uniref:MDIS1-interacting receptor like kinase 2 n=1 Tax=Camellia lanceoleosa TaxID=1840588 RepID=A0ACC0HR80_9ERIC|nr:MDIS1-interacting receptor like kinase 2 [Camellia lanceoleosa]